MNSPVGKCPEFVYDKGKSTNNIKEDPAMPHDNRRLKTQNLPGFSVGKMFFLSFSVTLCLILFIGVFQMFEGTPWVNIVARIDAYLLTI